MKNYLLLLLLSIMILPFSGCKKKSFDPMSKGQNDFIGTWKGSITTFKNNKLMKETGDIVIFPEAGGNLLSGIVFMKETSVFHEFQFSNGTLYFRVNCPDPANVNCQFWSLGGYAVFSEEGKIDFRISGNECGSVGNEFVDWNGTLSSAQVPSDSLQYFCFAKTGNSWTYHLTKKNGDTCLVQKQVGEMPSDYYFQGTSTQTCGWAGQNMVLKWSLSPYEFSIVNDTTFSQKGVTFPIDARIGVVYRSIVHDDTTTVTLMDTNLTVTTTAGIFNCAKFKYTEPIDTGVNRVTKTALLWLNRRFGIIRQEVVSPVYSTDIQLQVLSSKNF